MTVRKDSSETIAMTHIFSSDLQRASATASAILDAQRKRDDNCDEKGPDKVIKCVDLRERDFRSGEGTRFGASSGSGKCRGGGRNTFADAESWDEMSVRARRFIDEHLDRLLVEAGDSKEKEDRRTIIVVAHGLILNVLLSMLLLRYTPSEMTRLQPPLLPGAGVGSSDRKRDQLRVPWTNTGHLVIHASRLKTKSLSNADGSTADADAEASGVKLQVVSINCIEHLDGLKKTRGGIGSAQFDPKQKTMDSFFGPSAKRQKRGGDA
ncbi:hypothetical protein SBRCBS47491_005531 [Sporothrix bragantina]|uniref:Phosphoglycerate mutase family protein n=1 Tax=Sporothrix bragantina TaxID=671064 RepID=A0ABP0BYA7_9PEZI